MCFCTAKKTRENLCDGCKLVVAPLAKRGYRCAVCFRESVLARYARFCIGKPCHEVYQEHLAIQNRKREEQLEFQRRKDQERPTTSTSAFVHLTSVDDPWGAHDSCPAKRSNASWCAAPSERYATCEATSCSLSAAPSVSPQTEERHVHHLQVSGGTSSMTPSAVSATVVTFPQLDPDHDPWAIQDVSGTQYVDASSQSAPTRCSPGVEPEASLQLASSETLPQCAGDAPDYFRLIGQLVREVHLANVQLKSISAVVAEILSSTRTQGRP